MGSFILNFINWLLYFLSIIFTLSTIYGGAKFILARGNKNKEENAKKIFLYSIIVLVVLSFIYAMITPSPAPPMISN